MIGSVRIYGSAISQFEADLCNYSIIEDLINFEKQDRALQVLKNIFIQTEAKLSLTSKKPEKLETDKSSEKIFTAEAKVTIEEKCKQVKTQFSNIRKIFYMVLVSIYYHKNINRINFKSFTGILNIFNEGMSLMRFISENLEHDFLKAFSDEDLNGCILNNYIKDKMEDVVELFFKEVNLLGCWIAGVWREPRYQKNFQLNHRSLTFAGKDDHLFSVFSFIPFYSYGDKSFGRKNEEMQAIFDNFISEHHYATYLNLTSFEKWNIDIIENMEKFISMPFSSLTLRVIWLELQNILIDLFLEELNKYN